jgi:hypothetical protein
MKTARCKASPGQHAAARATGNDNSLFCDDQPRRAEIRVNVPEAKEVLVRLHSGSGVEPGTSNPALSPRQQHTVEVIFSRDAKASPRFQPSVQLSDHLSRAWNVLYTFATDYAVETIIRKFE